LLLLGGLFCQFGARSLHLPPLWALQQREALVVSCCSIILRVPRNIVYVVLRVFHLCHTAYLIPIKTIYIPPLLCCCVCDFFIAVRTLLHRFSSYAPSSLPRAAPTYHAANRSTTTTPLIPVDPCLCALSRFSFFFVSLVSLFVVSRVSLRPLFLSFQSPGGARSSLPRAAGRGGGGSHRKTAREAQADTGAAGCAQPGPR